MRVVLLLLVTCIFVGCTSDPSATASLSGSISFLGTEDYSDVTVALYSSAYLDTTLVRINQEYPHIGVIISQETEFDHRLQSPLSYAQTDAAGNFQINNIKPGKYNLAFLKDGISLKYLYDIILAEGENVQQRIELNPSIDISTPITEPITFKSGVQYNFMQNTVVISQATVEPGAILAISPQKKVEFLNNLNCPNEGYFKLTSSYSINEIIQSTMEDEHFFNNISVYGEDYVDLHNVLLSFVGDGVSSISPKTRLSNIVIDHNKCAIDIKGGEITIENILNKNSTVTSICVANGVQYSLNYFNAMNNISFNNSLNYEVLEMCSEISNNFFYKNDLSLKYYFAPESRLENNVFLYNVKSVDMRKSKVFISKNFFFENTETDIYFQYGSIMTVLSNNFYEKENVYIYILPRKDLGQPLNNIIDATNNFFINDDISNQIYDIHDNINCHYEVQYKPRALTPIGDAGIK